MTRFSAPTRVAGYVPNIPEALVAFLACGSLGAIWAPCAPDFGARSAVDRLAQIEPSVLLAVAATPTAPKDIDKTADLATIRAGRQASRVYRLHGLDGVTRWIWARAFDCQRMTVPR